MVKTMQMRDHNEISIVSGNSKKEGEKKRVGGWGSLSALMLLCIM